MRSLRARLTAWLTIGIGLVLVAGGLAMERLGTYWLRHGLESELVQQARALAELTEQEGGALQFEFAEGIAPEVRSYLAPEMFEIVGPGGRSMLRSPALASAGIHLPHLEDRATSPRLRRLHLPDGGRGLMVLMVQLDFMPRVELGTEAAARREVLPLSLLVATSAEDTENDVRLLRLSLAGAILATLLLSAVIIQWALRSGLRPVHTIQRQVEALRASRLDDRISVPGAPAELESVVTQLNGLLARLGASFDRERRLSSDIAHELRTPIAELRTLAEVGLRKRPEPEAERMLRDVFEISRQMERIVHHLLELARSEGGQESPRPHDLGVEEVLARAWKESERRARERHLDLTLDVAAGLTVRADPDKLHLVLGNLVSNAAENAPEGTTIRFFAQPVPGERDEPRGRVEITIVNQAPRLDPEDLEPMFERFWRKDSARTGGGHAGLGLSLVATVAEQLGIGVETTLDGSGELRVSLFVPPGSAPLSGP